MRRKFLLFFLVWSSLLPAAEFLDRIVAVVEDDVILASELERELSAIERQIEQGGSPLPERQALRRQVLERMILRSLQLQLAQHQGIQVDDETLRQALIELAQRNGMDLDTFRRAVENEGMNYAEFIENLRQEIMLSRMRAGQVNSQIQVSEQEVKHVLETETHPDPAQAKEYRLGHILIATPEAASPQRIQQAQQKAERLAAELRQGLDFHQAAITLSDGAQALQGGDLGWRKLDAVPSLFADLVPKMQPGEIQGPIRSPSGFHIIKLLEVKGGEEQHVVTETRVRHILIRPNEIIDDAEAKRRLNLLKQRLQQGEDFAALAQAYSDDKASAVKGGELGWVTAEAVVPAFREAMDRLKEGGVSDPVQTPFGWHLIQVLERKSRDDTAEYRQRRAKEILTQRKLEEETELWLRRLRAESYVEVHLDE